jgi:hypothetical protein
MMSAARSTARHVCTIAIVPPPVALERFRRPPWTQIPRTAVLGAILVTGYLGGAVASHVRAEDPGFFFAFTFGVLAWAGIYLREPRLRALVPLRQ